MKKTEFIIKGKDSRCQVFSGSHLFDEVVSYLKKQNKSKYVIITDSIVKRFHGDILLAKMLRQNLHTFLISFKAGEANKTRETKANIEDKMFKEKCGRDSYVIALGGGVVGDMAGFVAGTYMRGIPCIQIPTTTIAIGDSSYGGKTAIDVPAGKNLIGVFHNPEAVFMDSSLLVTLDNRNYVSGLVEIIKHSIIKDKKFYNFLKENIDTIITRKGNNYEKVVERVVMDNIAIKREVVAADPTESNLRKILNYGHTIGHAVEKLSNYSLLHGEAIAIGICAEAFLAYKRGIMSIEDFNEQRQIFKKMGLNINIPNKIITKDIVNLMSMDKKARNTRPEFSLIKKIGQYAVFKNGKVATSFPESSLYEAINEYRRL